MTVRVLPAGDGAMLIELDGPDAAVALTQRVRSAHLPAIVDLVPAARTLLLQTVAGTDLTAIRRTVLELAVDLPDEASTAAASDPLVIEVRYDGPDLPAVAQATGLDPAGVVRAHTETPWRTLFIGFAPGFAYLTGGDSRLQVPRRTESRTSVPAGAVALAGEFSAVYPRASPGGWQLIGSTDAVLWDIEADPPAVLQPGRWVRFVDITDHPHTDRVPS
ncbi:MAG: allophanate hydrolase subunit 1 [Nakamurella sp.]